MTFDVWKQAQIMKGLDKIKTTSIPARDISLDDMKKLAGVDKPSHVQEAQTINKAAIMRENNIRPGTDEWFKLWFAKPHITGEKPFGE
jgi:hypothetical protein